MKESANSNRVATSQYSICRIILVKSDRSFTKFMEQKQGTTLEESKSKLLESLERVSRVGQLNRTLNWDRDKHWGPFYSAIHHHLFDQGDFTISRISHLIEVLWVNDIYTQSDLLGLCAKDYDLVKRRVFMGSEVIQSFFEKICSIPEHLRNLENNEVKINVNIEFGGQKVERDFGATRRVADIKEYAAKKWQKSLGIANFTLHQGEDEVDSGVRVRELSSPVVLSVKSTPQIGFSKVPNLETALEMCGPGTVCHKAVPLGEFMTDPVKQEITQGPGFESELTHAHGTFERLRKVHPIEYGNETTKRSYINPIVIAASMLSPEVTFQEELKIEGPFANGPVDYAFMYKEAIICVTEAKNESMEHGLRQNIAQLAATRYKRKRKFSAMDDKFTYYGIATTYFSWQLIELKGAVVKASEYAQVRTDSTPRVKEDMSDMIAHVVNVLEKSKRDYDNHVASIKS